MIITILLYAFLISIALITGFLMFWKFWFLRDPYREIPKAENDICCPADGTVIKIIDLEKLKSNKIRINKGLIGKINTITDDVKNAKYLISIFMTPFNVHVQRSPIYGIIKKTKYNKGRFIAANSINALTNENNEILIKGKKGEMKVIQIAGYLARRIESFVNLKNIVAKGERIGRINLGSQVTIILPKNVKLTIKKQQKVFAGKTIIAKFN